jgi:hypothetical protein
VSTVWQALLCAEFYLSVLSSERQQAWMRKGGTERLGTLFKVAGQ